MSKVPWRRFAAIWLIAASSLAAQEKPKPDSTPAGPTLVFDAQTKEYKADAEEDSAQITFYATNVWTNTIVIQAVYASCHCSSASLPAYTWILPPGSSGAVTAQIDLSGSEEGTVTKTLTFFTSLGERELTLKVSLTPPPLPEDERKAAMSKASAGATAIFKGDCATCHLDKARGLLGKDLYAATCGHCHEDKSIPSHPPAGAADAHR